MRFGDDSNAGPGSDCAVGEIPIGEIERLPARLRDTPGERFDEGAPRSAAMFSYCLIDCNSFVCLSIRNELYPKDSLGNLEPKWRQGKACTSAHASVHVLVRPDPTYVSDA